MKFWFDSRRLEATEESSPDVKSRGQVGNQPTCVYDCYSTATSYQLPLSTYRKYDCVTGVTGCDVIGRGSDVMQRQLQVATTETGNGVIAAATTPGYVTSIDVMDCETTESDTGTDTGTGLPASLALYHPYSGSVTT